MKIAFIASDNNASSGAFLSMAGLAKQLNSFGVETIIFLPPDRAFVGPGDGEGLLKEMNLRYILIPSYTWIYPLDFKKTWYSTLGQIKNITLNKLFYAKKLSKILKRENVDLVHINTSYSYFGAYAAKYAKTPFIWHIREFLEEDQGNAIYFKRFGYRLMNRADLVIAISNSIYGKYKPIITRTELKVIYNGIDTERFYVSDKQLFSSDCLQLLYTGGLSKWKGTDDLLQACVLLNNAGYKNAYTLSIAGRGEEAYEQSMKDRISRYDLSNVRLLGYQKDVASVMKTADVSIITSRFEAFGRVTVEAMLSGNLILGADSAGTKELLQDGKLGILYQCGNAESIRDNIIYIIEHKKELIQKANAGRQYMHDNMTVEKNASAIYEEYKKLLEDK